MRLSKRLKAITEFVDKEDRIIDIGCDHALLDIYIKENINFFIKNYELIDYVSLKFLLSLNPIIINFLIFQQIIFNLINSSSWGKFQ